MPVVPVHGSLHAVIVWKPLMLEIASLLWKVSVPPGWIVGMFWPTFAWYAKDWMLTVLSGAGALHSDRGSGAPVGSPPWLSFSCRCPWVRTSVCGMHGGGLLALAQSGFCASTPPTSVPS